MVACDVFKDGLRESGVLVNEQVELIKVKMQVRRKGSIRRGDDIFLFVRIPSIRRNG